MEKVEKGLTAILFTCIGEEKNGGLTSLAEEHARTKRLIIKEVIKHSKKVAVLFNSNNAPATSAARIMAGELSNVWLRGVYHSHLSSHGSFEKDTILRLMREHERMDILIVIGTAALCYQMPNHYAAACGIQPFVMEFLGPNEIYKLDLAEETLDILSCVPAEQNEVFA